MAVEERNDELESYKKKSVKLILKDDLLMPYISINQKVQ